MMMYLRAHDLLAKAYKRGKTRAKIGNNTYLERCFDRHAAAAYGDCIAIKYHNTQVIQLRPDGTYQLFTGGYNTVTTRKRFKDWTPARLYSERGQLYLTVNVVHTEIHNDPLRKIFDEINEYGSRTLPLAVKWSVGGVDPVVAAWNVSNDFGAMLQLLVRFGKTKGLGKLKKLIRDNKISVADAFEIVKKAKPPTASEVIKKLAVTSYHYHQPIYVPYSFHQRTEFYDGIIVDAAGREVKNGKT